MRPDAILSSQPFPDGFQMHAQCGMSHLRYVAESLSAALAWKAFKEEEGWTVSEPQPYDRWADNVVELRAPAETRRVEGGAA